MKAVRLTGLAAAVIAAMGVSGNVEAGGRSDLVLAALEAGRAQYNPGELLVQFSVTSDENDRAAVRHGLGASRQEVVRAQGRDNRGQLELLSLPPGLAIADAVRGLEGVADVEFAEPNWAYFHAAASNDTYYMNGSLFGMYGDATSPANQYGSQAGEAWAAGKTDCSSVYVGIIDEGYMYSHPDLAANAATVPGEIAGNGIDDNGNGYVDDVRGWDFDGGNNEVFDGAGDDHGTHVAGTIGGVGGNGTGVAGVCWSVTLLNAKFLGRRGGTTANAIKAVDYFTDLKNRGVNLVATNNSWGGGGFSQGLQDAIGRANTANVLFIAAAGNDAYNCDSGSSCYPAEYPNANIIAVASLTSSGAMSSFSSYGASTVDIGAPGSAIWSTVPKASQGSVIASYASYSGTSMATPHVAGAAALYAAYHAGSSAATIKAAIMSSAVPTTSMQGKVVSGGRLNVSGF
ncbi:MAG TPA: S8 family serine peptidase [Candidatus Saccharimonadia bacterium]|nr:S8 family serine peptidase [Candidatus Saccharimonadia bacterium]